MLSTIAVLVVVFFVQHIQAIEERNIEKEELAHTADAVTQFANFLSTPLLELPSTSINSVSQYREIQQFSQRYNDIYLTFLNSNIFQQTPAIGLPSDISHTLDALQQELLNLISIYSEQLEFEVSLPDSEHEYFVNAILLNLRMQHERIKPLQDALRNEFIMQRDVFDETERNFLRYLIPIIVLSVFLCFAVYYVMQDSRKFIYLFFCADPAPKLALNRKGEIQSLNHAARHFFKEQNIHYQTQSITELCDVNWPKVQNEFEQFRKQYGRWYLDFGRITLPKSAFLNQWIKLGNEKSVLSIKFQYTFICSIFGNKILVSLHDISDLQKLQKANEQDSFTELKTKTFALERLNDEIERAKRSKSELALVFFDIDEFKDINDQYGHPFGDKVIQWVAAKIKKRMRQTDILGRFGGDEFIIICPECNAEQAKKISESIRSQLKTEKFTVNISVGVTQLNFNDSMESLIKRADEAMYQAKQLGKNQVYVMA